MKFEHAVNDKVYVILNSGSFPFYQIRTKEISKIRHEIKEDKERIIYFDEYECPLPELVFKSEKDALFYMLEDVVKRIKEGEE